jgi:ribosomal protein S6
MAELLIENGAEVDAIVNEKKGYTLLMLFCAQKEKLSERELQVNLDVIRFLVQSNASKEKKSEKGKTALDLARKHQGKLKIEKIFKEV